MKRRTTRMAAIGMVCCLAFASSGRSENGPPDTTQERASAADAYSNPLSTLGSWIWADTTSENQSCQFWRAFEIPANVTVRKARLRMTADNEFMLYLDGRELGRGAEWRELFDFDITPLLSPGRHVLAVHARNSFSYAGLLFGLHIDLSNGGVVEVKSDENWRVVPADARGWETTLTARSSWPAATIQAPFGGDPWWTTPLNVNVMPVLRPIKHYFWQSGWFQVLLLSLCVIALLFSLWLIAQLAIHKNERLLLQRERARIAMDIHDDLGSRMTQLVLHGEVLQSDLPHESSLGPQLDVVCQEARGVLSSLDEILWAVNPRCDTLNDFSSYVCGYVEDFLKPTSIQCLFDVDTEASDVTLQLPVRRMLLMAIKETVSNAAKYSEATELLLQIKLAGRKLEVVVQDNGRGFDPKSVKPGRNGLRNMSRRMSELGGTCAVVSRPGTGCRVEFALTLNASRNRAFGWMRNRNPSLSITERNEARSRNQGRLTDS